MTKELELKEALSNLLAMCCDNTVGKLDTENEDEEFGALMAVGHIFKSKAGQEAYRLVKTP